MVGWAVKAPLVRVVGGVAFRTINPISLFFNTKHDYLFTTLFSYIFRFPLTNLFIYSLDYLFLNFWYFSIHKFNWFPQSKILCVFECSFCSFTVRACLCVSVTYLHVCLHIQLYLICPCCLFVQDLYMFEPMLVYICVHLCVFVFRISCECLYINCQATRALQQSQTVSKIFLSKEKVFH